MKKSTLALLIAGAFGMSSTALAADKADSTAAPQDPKLEQLDKSHPATGGQKAEAPAKQPKLEDVGAAHPATPKAEKGQAGRAGDDVTPQPGAAAGASRSAETQKTDKPAAADKAADKSAESSSGTATGNSHWGQIDTDNDNLVTPAEMEKFLQAKGGSGASKDTGAAGPKGESGASAASDKPDVKKEDASKAKDQDKPQPK